MVIVRFRLHHRLGGDVGLKHDVSGANLSLLRPVLIMPLSDIGARNKIIFVVRDSGDIFGIDNVRLDISLKVFDTEIADAANVPSDPPEPAG